MVIIENRPVKNPSSRLAGVFMGGRISGWVKRNRPSLETDQPEEVELDLLGQLSSSFAKSTEGLPAEKRVDLIKEALAEADKNPLSATNYRPSR